MRKKLTLNIDEELIEFAHQLSEKNDQQISEIIEDYLAELKNQESDSEQSNLDPKIIDLYGILADQEIPDKKELRRQFHEKDNS